MEILLPLLENPFTLGLLLGLIITGVVWFTGLSKRRDLKKKISDLEGHLHTKMSIDNKGNRAIEKEVEDLKKKNENLRITVAALKSRPDKADTQILYLYDRAIRLMNEKSPGFAPTWELVLKEAQEEIDKTNEGWLPWRRKKIRPSLSGGSISRELPSGHEGSEVEFIEEKKRKRLKR